MVKNLWSDFAPSSISIDFEMAVINAIEVVFPDTNVWGYFFHMVQNMKKKLGENGLKRRYETEPDISIKCRMITAMAFVKPEDIVGWIVSRRGDFEPPMFAHTLWNVYERTMKKQHRTNNHAEPQIIVFKRNLTCAIRESGASQIVFARCSKSVFMDEEQAAVWWWWIQEQEEDQTRSYIRPAHMMDAIQGNSFRIFWRYYDSSDYKDMREFSWTNSDVIEWLQGLKDKLVSLTEVMQFFKDEFNVIKGKRAIYNHMPETTSEEVFIDKDELLSLHSKYGNELKAIKEGDKFRVYTMKIRGIYECIDCKHQDERPVPLPLLFDKHQFLQQA
uniref:MULE transposase domain-containing protein n=1 Tax=Ditylenchus dipsaci TaxID=166011 RepID=A0A915CSM5_9BILA